MTDASNTAFKTVSLFDFSVGEGGPVVIVLAGTVAVTNSCLTICKNASLKLPIYRNQVIIRSKLSIETIA